MTWKDIKLSVLQKMFAADGTTIPSDDSTRDYLAAMPYAANEGILMMSTAGKYLVKQISISVSPAPNLLGENVGASIHSKIKGETVFTADNAHSYYFEVTGVCIVHILVGDILYKSEVIDAYGKYQPMKGLIPNVDGKNVKLIFGSDYPYSVKNVALYEANYGHDDRVPAYAERLRYKMPEYAEDFYSINSIYFEGDLGDKRYIKTDDVYQEGDRTLALLADEPGNYIIYYNALPPEITEATPDDYVLPLDREVVALLPLYMASQIYKDDDVAISTTYRNEFEVGFERLVSSQPNGKAEKVISESGWI